ncbi:hypothetical protein [Nonlabens sp.]|uniref:hypothetical protein n=1 Tax=Nonlabens sp. TaxID=1888209 RepID=UPI003F69B91A
MKKSYNGVFLLLGILFLGASWYFENNTVFFQVIGIVLLMVGAYGYSSHRSQENADGDE